MKKKGFTLVELLVVIAILAILATVSIVGYTGFIKKAKVSNATVELTQIRDLMIAADIDDSVEYGVEKTETEPANNKTYYIKNTDGEYVEANLGTGEERAFDSETTYYKDLKRTDLFDTKGLDCIEEAKALWDEIKADAGKLKGTLSFDDCKLYYKLDDAIVSYEFGANAAFDTNVSEIPTSAKQIYPATTD